jgi:hypothetical protein
LSRKTWATFFLSSAENSSGPSFIVSLSMVPVKRKGAAFYDKTLFWQWMRMPDDVVFALGALLMAWDFIVKLHPRSLPVFVGDP